MSGPTRRPQPVSKLASMRRYDSPDSLVNHKETDATKMTQTLAKIRQSESAKKVDQGCTIELLVKAGSAPESRRGQMISVPSDWTQLQLADHLRALAKSPQSESMQLSVGGKPLRQPNATLSESSLAPYSQVTCEHVPLFGGMKLDVIKKAAPKKVIQLNEEEETPREPTSGGLGDALRRRISLNVSSTVKREEINQMTLDYAQFEELNTKIKEGESTDEIEEQFRPMARKYVQASMVGFQKPTEVEKDLWQKQYNYYQVGTGEEIKAAQDFVEGVTTMHQLPVEYVWQSMDGRHIPQYEAVLCRVQPLKGEPEEYTLYVQEVMGHQKIVFEENFAELPSDFICMHRRCLSFYDAKAKRMRMNIFVWNNEHKTTQVVKRAVVLPPEIEVKKEIYHNEELRKKMAENLLQSLFTENYATPKHIDTLANARISPVQNEYFNQISLSMWDMFAVNTENHGVLFWDLKKIPIEQEQLLLKDAEKPQNLGGEHENYSVDYLINWNPGDACVILSQNFEEKMKWKLQDFMMSGKNRGFENRGPGGTMNLPVKYIKAIQSQHHNCLFLLDMEGNVYKYVGGGGLNAMKMWSDCTDIYLTDALYARQFYVDNEGKLQNKIIKLNNESEGYLAQDQDDFTISTSISRFNSLEGYFSRTIIAYDHILCVHGSSMYIRKESRDKWLECIDFEHHIMALLPVGGEKVDTKTLCATEKSIEILTLKQSGSGIKRGDQLNLPGRILSVEIGENKWHESNIFVLTQGEENLKDLRLWVCTPDLKPTLLVRDDSQHRLDRDSYCRFLHISKKSEEQGPNEKPPVSLVCTVGKEQRFVQFYTMPEQEVDEQPPNQEYSEYQPLMPAEPRMRKRLEVARLGESVILSFFEYKQGEQINYFLIVKGIQLTGSSIHIFDEDLQRKNMPALNARWIQSVSDKLYNERYLFGLGVKQNLNCLDLDSILAGFVPYQIMVFKEYTRRKINIDKRHLNLCGASGTLRQIPLDPFSGQTQLQESEDNIYLAWQQKGNVFGAVDRFNIVTYWNTLTGKLVYKKALPESEWIEDAFIYRAHDAQYHYEQATNLFDARAQMLVSFRMYPKQEGGTNDTHKCKLVKLNLFGDGQKTFSATCKTLATFKLEQNSIRNRGQPKHSHDYHMTYVYADHIKSVIMLVGAQPIWFQRCRKGKEDEEWLIDRGSSQPASIKIGCRDKGSIINQISPNGRYMLRLKNGIEILELVNDQEYEKGDIILKPTQWQIPLETKSIPHHELETRVRFESNTIIRYINLDNRDLLYQLDPNGKSVHYIGEVKVENFFKKPGHKLGLQQEQESFEQKMVRTSQIMAFNRHKQILKSYNRYFQPDKEANLNQKDINTLVKKHFRQEGFRVHLSFSLFEWYLAEKFVNDELTIETLGERNTLQLTVGVFPQQWSTLIHMIAGASKKEDQILASNQIRALIETADNFVDEEMFGTVEPGQFQLPIMMNKQGQTPFWQMDEANLRVLLDVLLRNIPFRRIIRKQGEVEKLLSQEDPSMMKFIDSSLVQTPSCAEIEALDLPVGMQIVTFRHQASRLSPEQIQNAVDESIPKKQLCSCLGKQKVVNTKCIVRMLDIRWILRDGKGFLDFVPILEDFERDNLFQSDFMQALAHEYWVGYLKKILWRCFMPWCLYSIFSLMYFSQVLRQGYTEDADEAEKVKWYIIGSLIIVQVVYQLYIESWQIMHDGWDYWKSLYNYFDLFQYIGTLFVVGACFGGSQILSVEKLRTLCAFILLSQGSKAIIDWLRLFDQTSFYVTLILHTFRDIAYFMLIMVLLLLYVGIAMYMLQLNADPAVEESAIIIPVFGNLLIDSTLNQFLLMIGEYNMEGYTQHVNPALCYLLFILTVLISQITFLNMLIAIMSDTFEKVIEQKPTFSLKNKLMSLAAMESVIRTNEEAEDSKVFLYVVMPDSGEDGEGMDSTSGSYRGKTHYTISLMKSLHEQTQEVVQTIATEQKKQNEKTTATREQVVKQTDTMQKQINSIAAKFESMDAKFESMQADLKAILEK